METTTPNNKVDPKPKRASKSKSKATPPVASVEPISEEELREEFQKILDDTPTGPTSLERLGFIRTTAPRYEWVGYPEAEDPATGLKAEIRSNLSFAESDAIPLGAKATFDQMRESLAPYIRNWNLMGRDLDTGSVTNIPPPQQGGPDMMLALDKEELVWLAMAVKYRFRQIHETEEGKKNLTKSENSEKP